MLLRQLHRRFAGGRFLGARLSSYRLYRAVFVLLAKVAVDSLLMANQRGSVTELGVAFGVDGAFDSNFQAGNKY